MMPIYDLVSRRRKAHSKNAPRLSGDVLIDKKKGPNLRWSLIQCSGGDEGDRTPDLLTASQALSQLSYAPVRKSTIRELARRCKDNFRKTFAGAAPRRPFERAGPCGSEGPVVRPEAAPPATVPLSGPIALPPTRALQNHAGLRGQAGNPRARRIQWKQNRR